MNRKGSVLIYMMMLGVLVILLALWLAPSVQDFVDEARNETTGLDCSNSTISNYNKATCLVLDLNMFYFIGALIFIGGVIIVGRVIFAGE